MIGPRRAFGVRVDSQRNVAALVDKQNAKNTLIKPLRIVEEKKPVVTKAVVERKVYGGRQCMINEQLAVDIDKYLSLIEKKRQLDSNFLKEAKIDGRMRGILLDWIMQIQTKFKLSPETFYLSCCILDRIIVPLDVTKQNFQLIGLACIFIASKFEEVLIPNVHDFVYMGGDCCTIDNLFQAERDVLKALEFQLSFTYPIHFLRKMRLLMSSDEQSMVYEVSKLLVDVSMIDYEMASWLPSESAAASVYLAHKILQRPFPMELLEEVGASTLKIVDKSKKLADRLSTYANETGKLKGLRLKYEGSKMLKVVDNYIVPVKERCPK